MFRCLSTYDARLLDEKTDDSLPEVSRYYSYTSIGDGDLVLSPSYA